MDSSDSPLPDRPQRVGARADPDSYSWRKPAVRAARLGGLLAAGSSVLLALHLGGDSGVLVGIGFALAGLALAGASMALGARRLLPPRARQLRYWALLGAMGFVVSGIGLVADLLAWPIVLSEVVAILAVGFWWLVMARHLLVGVNERAAPAAMAGARPLGYLSLVCAVLVLAAVGAQLLVEAPAGAVPARMAYLLWGPWGLVLAARLARAADPV